LSVLAFGLALAHPWSGATIGHAQYGDAAYWDFAGENWARGYLFAKTPDIRPGYSVFLGIVYVLSGATFEHAFVAQAALFGACVGIVYAVGHAIRGRLAGVLAAALLALDPYLWEWVATSTTELLGAFANLMAVFFAVRASRPRGPLADFVWLGLCLGVANVVRPITLPFIVPALGLVLLLRRSALRTRLMGCALAVLALGVGLLPGVVYQYVTSGDASLSSNSAANLYAASSPKYLTWTPAIYDDVSAEMTARGETVTQERLNAEFTRLTVLNYLEYPGFQVQRVAGGFREFGAFEGEASRPDRFFFFRPWVLAAGALATVALLIAGRTRPWWCVGPGLLLVAGLATHPDRTITGLAILGVGMPLVGIWRDARSLGWLVVAALWATTALFAILTTGIEGFFLNRLYTQVEPERAILLALAVVELSSLPVLVRRRAPILQMTRLVRALGWRLPRRARTSAAWLGMGVVLVVGAGLVRLAAVNLQPAPSEALPAPTVDQLQAVAARLGLTGPTVYVDTASFGPTRNQLMSGSLPTSTSTTYAFPGEYTRFLWYLDDQDRTLFWYVFSDLTRPASLDRNLITGETPGRLDVSTYSNRMGLLFVTPTSSYFDQTGVVELQNVLSVRGFAPWDAVSQRFQFEDTTAFPLAWPLYDDVHVKAAERAGNVSDPSPIRLQADGPMLRSLDFRPGRTQPATLTYSDIAVPPASEFRADVGLHPRLAGNNGVGHPRLQVTLRTADGQTVQLLDHSLDPRHAPDLDFSLLQADLGAYAGQSIDLTISATADPTATQDPDILVGEPKLYTP
jgi:hypothetical protein